MQDKTKSTRLTRKEKVDRIRGYVEFVDPNKGPAKKDSQRNDVNDPIG